jgi:phospho-N-acetylmuramoyl-pentapeptide-transferase
VLYHAFLYFSQEITGFNVSRYITFRSMMALLSAIFLSFLLSPWFIRKLKTKQMGQVVRDDGPKSHFSKAGTPTMGGGLIIMASLIPCLLWMNWTNSYVWSVLVIFTGYGLVGFFDDYLKVSKKNTKGVPGRVKLFWQIGIAALVCGVHVFYGQESGLLTVPFLKNTFIDLGPLYLPFSVFVIVGASNAVNLTDGLDGLAIGPVMIAGACYGLLAYVSGHKNMADYLHFPFVPGTGELCIFAACLVGAGMGFLWYNTYPAQVFMGDVGSLPLGGALGALAIFSKHELLLALIGGIFVLEAVSVITQVVSFKLTGKRVFRMAPIHHHFELKGWPEPKVIVRFWIISIVLGILGLLSLKIR